MENREGETNPVGRPSSYKPEYVAIAAKLCRLGATDDDLAEAFGVSDTTIDNWKNAHPEFLGSLKAAKEEADAEVVKSLYQRAKGYEHPDVHASSYEGQVTLTPITKHYPPDTTACIFWLKNRQPKSWRDKVEADLTSGGERIRFTLKLGEADAAG